jgi:hypothetical protein
MSERRGCFKNGCLGCLGLLVLVFVFVGINTVIVLNRGDDEYVEDQVIGTDSAEATAPLENSQAAPPAGDKPDAGQGWLILELGQGEFELHPGQPGDGVVVKANYDASIYELEQYSHTWADSSWVYHVRFQRTITGLQAILREIMGGSEGSQLHIYVPPDLPIELNVLVKEGGLDADLGGLWLTDVDLRFNKGGIMLDVSEPLHQPLNSLMIRGRMGGGEISHVGNASPRVLDVSCGMGGVELDLRGAWSNDCDARLKVTMGGMDVQVPDNIELEDASAAGDTIRRTDGEITRPVLRLRQEAKMGEIDVR